MAVNTPETTEECLEHVWWLSWVWLWLREIHPKLSTMVSPNMPVYVCLFLPWGMCYFYSFSAAVSEQLSQMTDRRIYDSSLLGGGIFTVATLNNLLLCSSLILSVLYTVEPPWPDDPKSPSPLLLPSGYCQYDHVKYVNRCQTTLNWMSHSQYQVHCWRIKSFSLESTVGPGSRPVCYWFITII